MKRPLLTVALLYICGILCGEHLRLALRVLFGMSFLVAALTLMFERGRPWFCGLLVALTGWTGPCSAFRCKTPLICERN